MQTVSIIRKSVFNYNLSVRLLKLNNCRDFKRNILLLGN